MKRMAWMVVGALLLTVSFASAQSLGDVARAARKSKPRRGTTGKYFDNDNLPRNQKLSVVGPQPASDTTSAELAKDGQTAKDAGAAADGKVASAKPAASEKAGTDAMNGKIEAQKQKIDSIAKDLDLTQREYRLRAAAMYSDAGNRLRNAEEWDKEDAQYKKDISDKQAALDAAKQELTQMEEQQRTGEAPGDKSNPVR
jgi:hypothetical protein